MPSIKEYETEKARDELCKICSRDARVEIEGNFYCWCHGESTLLKSDKERGD